MKKLEVNVTFWGKLHDFKEIFRGEDAHKWPLLKKEKKPCLFTFFFNMYIVTQKSQICSL